MINISNSYVTIQGWMAMNLDITANELIVYASIYGFCQDGKSKFYGTRDYLATWCGGVSIKTITNITNSLKSKNLIKNIGTENEPVYDIVFETIREFVSPGNYGNGEKSSLYQGKKFTTDGEKSSLGREKSSHNNIIDNTSNDIKEIKKEEVNKKKKESKQITDTDKEIMNYLNEKTGYHLRNTDKNISLIHARLSEGYTLNDFKIVIDVKCKEWLNTEMEQWLLPKTIFSKTHFDDYLNAGMKKVVDKKVKKQYNNDELQMEYKSYS